jgi:hypothetical protein
MKLHIVNGGATTTGLHRAAIGGEIVEYADVLHEGPVLPDADTDAWLDTRAAFLAECDWAEAAEVKRYIGAWQERVAHPRDFDEVVLWYEHDLFDQLLLIRVLSWWWQHAPVDPPSLVSPADYLGLQSSAQLTALFAARQRVSEAQLTLAASAWQAFTAPAPDGLARLLMHENTVALPHLEGALRRLLEEYPSHENGVGRTERQVLQILEQSPLTAFDLFTANAKREERVFMGDSTFFLRLARLLSARRPLIERTSADGPVLLTDTGRRVLAGELDDVAINGIDRWIGGVHLTPENVWRWDGDTVRKA